jgi:hypothetical protein
MKNKKEDTNSKRVNQEEAINEIWSKNKEDLISELKRKVSESEIELNSICMERESLLELYLDDVIGQEEYSIRILIFEDQEFEIQLEIRVNKLILDSLLL